MNRCLFLILWAFTPLMVGADGARPPALEKLLSKISPSLVRVEYQLQFDKGDSPSGVVGDEQRSERGRRGALAALVEEERPAETSGFVTAPDEVVTFTPEIHPRFVKSIRVTFRGESIPAQISAHAQDTWAIRLKLEKPLADAKPLVFPAKAGKPRYLVHYYRNNAQWGVHLTGFPSDTMNFESGRSIRPLDSTGLVISETGEALGLAFDNLPLDTSWQGSPAKWNWVTESDMQSRLGDLRRVLEKSVLHVRLSFRSPKGAGRQMMRGDRDEDDSDKGTERDVLGVVLPGNKLLILEELKPRTTARLERILAIVDGKPVQARFVASLKDFGALVAEGEANLGPGITIADGDLAKHLDVLMLRADILMQGENRVDYLRPGRIGGMKLGPKGRYYPDLLDDAERVAWIFTPGKELVSIPVERRDAVTGRRDRSDGGRSDPARPTHAQVLAKVVAQLPAGADPANVPVSDVEENRLAWFGVELQPLTRELARANGVSDQTRDGRSGALVTYVHPDSPAGKAGIAAGSILLRLRVPGQPLPVEVLLEEDPMRAGPFPWDRLDQIGEQFFDRIPSPWSPAENTFTRALTDLGFGTRFVAEFFVDGKSLSREFEVLPGPTHYESSPRFKSESLGLTVRDLTYDVRRYLQRPVGEPGVVVGKVEPGGKASVAGVKPYELITHINDQPVQNVGDFETLAAKGGELKLSVKRMTKGRIVTVKAGNN